MSRSISFLRGAKQKLALAALLALSLAQPLHAQLIVVPGSQAGSEGNISNAFPFNIGNAGLVTQRYQQVYGSSAFGALSGPSFITAIAFRADITGQSFSSVLPNVQINLSTTAFGPDALSTVFAANIGLNETVVFSGSLALSSAAIGSPRAFDIVISLATPFLFDPAAGNLLLDVRNFSGGVSTQFDAQSTSLDSVSRVYSHPNTPSNVADTLGLITRFTFSPNNAVPEPSTYGLVAGVGLFGLVLFRQRKTRRS